MTNLASVLRLPGNLKSTQWQILAGPILILLILSMMVLPLPAFILDLLFTFNIALSIMVLLVAMFTQRTLDFAAFPTILLFTTLLRLALNVASTRIILMEGHTGAAAAGKWWKRSVTFWLVAISPLVSWCLSFWSSSTLWLSPKGGAYCRSRCAFCS
ncbi:hypothetical protein DKG79_09720 [Escherichia fergusonii]|nr:hypothetical protein DKG79_09720 [Escherichia fergusonii]